MQTNPGDCRVTNGNSVIETDTVCEMWIKDQSENCFSYNKKNVIGAARICIGIKPPLTPFNDH